MGTMLAIYVSSRSRPALRDKLRITDTIARSGGEEFIVLLGQLKSPGDAGYVAQVLLNCFHQSLMIEGHTINLSASIGIAIYPADAKEAHQLWRLADSAMYRAKHAGGNQYVFVASNENVCIGKRQRDRSGAGRQLFIGGVAGPLLPGRRKFRIVSRSSHITRIHLRAFQDSIL